MSGDVAELEREADALPDGWRSYRLGDVATLSGGTTPSRAEPAYWENATIPWATPSDITSLPVGISRIADTETKVSDRALAECSLTLNPPGTVLMTSRATIGFVAVNDVPMATNQGFITFRAGERLDADFLLYWLTAQRGNLVAAAGGSTFKELSRGTAKLLPIPLPPLDEQRRIAEVLRSVDEALEVARRVTEQCKQVLRLELDSVVTNLLADGVAQEKLGEVAKVKGGKRLPKGSAYSDEPTGNPYIRVTDWRDYEIRTDDIRFISDEIAQSIWRYTISKSDLFISIAGSVGLVAAVPDELDGAYLTENAAKICINDPKALNSTFLLAVLRSSALAEQISKHKGVGGGVPKLALFRIEDLDIPLPDISVQAEIASSYQSVRASIETARSGVDQLEMTRRDVMSDLLSGRVRVPA